MDGKEEGTVGQERWPNVSGECSGLFSERKFLSFHLVLFTVLLSFWVTLPLALTHTHTHTHTHTPHPEINRATHPQNE